MELNLVEHLNEGIHLSEERSSTFSNSKNIQLLITNELSSGFFHNTATANTYFGNKAVCYKEQELMAV